MKNSKEEELINQLRTARGMKDRKNAVEALFEYCFNKLLQYGKQRKDRIAEEDLRYMAYQSLADLVEIITENKVNLNKSLQAYSKGILRNKILNHLRTANRQREHHDIVVWLTSYSLSPSGEDLIIQREMQEERIAQVNNTLEQLSETCKEFFQLWMKGLEYVEIAEELGYKVSGIKVMAFRCRKDFRNKLRA